MAKIPKTLESAILGLTTKEKDKMLLKLIGKNELLIEQLHFQLLEDDSDLKERRQTLKDLILKVAKMYHDTAGWMMMDMRDLNGRITRHVKVSKDKYGEVERRKSYKCFFWSVRKRPRLERYLKLTFVFGISAIILLICRIISF